MNEYERGYLKQKGQWSLDVYNLILCPFSFCSDLQDLGINPATDVRILVLIWNMGAERPGEVSKEVGSVGE